MKRLSLAATAAALLCSSALAQDGGVLVGADAFGGWKDDKPGVQRHITVDDLEAPFVSESASNSAQPVPMPEGATQPAGGLHGGDGRQRPRESPRHPLCPER